MQLPVRFWEFLSRKEEIAQIQTESGYLMYNHKFFIDFKPAPLSAFFTINKQLSQPGSRLKLHSSKAVASAKKPTSARKAA